jgi:small subunit ribosomal protein S24e
MEVQIKEKHENQMIPRIEIHFGISYEQAPPTRVQIVESLAKQLNAQPNLVVIRKMHNVFGMRKNVGIAHVYPDDATLKKYVSKYILIRMGLAQKEEKKAAAPKAAAVKKKIV